ncbi:MAG: ketopantoate reductase family protein [Candidatus Saccharibacteria bacterium]
MEVLIVGLGALGTVFGCFLKNSGHSVHALDTLEMVSQMSEREVKVTGIWGDHSAHLDSVVARVDDLDVQPDLIIITVKSFDTEQVAAGLKSAVKANTRVILAQNGYGNYESAQLHIPKENLIVGRVIFGAETLAPGQSKVTVIADDVILGSPDGSIAEAEVGDLARLINDAGVPCRASSDVMKYMWGKIIYNSALNSLGAILEVNYGKLAAMDESYQTMNQVIHEIFAVLKAMNEVILWPDAENYIKDFYTKLVPPTANHHPSMLQDIQRGRRTEIDALNGAVCRLGGIYGVPTPVNETITRLVKAKELLVRGL